MTRTVARPDLGEMLAKKREFFPTAVASVNKNLARRPMPMGVVSGLSGRARDLLGFASWFAPRSQLMFECVHLQAQAACGAARVAAAAPGQSVEIELCQENVSVVREDKAELRSVNEWADAWCAALVARDQPLLVGMRSIPDELHRPPRVQIDAYQYTLTEALVAVADDRDRCLAAVARGREQWKQRSVAHKLAAAIDAAMFDLIEALVGAEPGPFNDALFRALTAHAKYWSRGDEYLAARGWVALRHVALACLAHDRGMAVEIESGYLPRALIERQFSATPSLAAPP
jgi:hypothetical protein